MKSIKKIILVFMISLLSVFVIPTKAASKDNAVDPSGVSTYTPTESTVKDIYGMTHTLQKATTTTNGASKAQLINAFEMKTDGVTSKLVTWAVQNDNSSYKRADIIEAAKDYEANHPGWIVTGGINADQYFFKFGNKVGVDGSAIFQPSPYYPMITDGEKRYTVNPYNNSSNVVGFKNDGSTNSFAYPDGKVGGYQLSIIDELGNEITTFVVNGINRSALNAETTVWCAPVHTGYANQMQEQVINTSNQLYVVENADLAYVSIDDSYGYPSGAPTSLFCKGTISNSSLKEYTVSKGQFAIETTDEKVIAALNDGLKVKVELLFGSEELNAVDEAMGYHSAHIINNVVQTENGNNSYNSKAYSRALMGKKADGTYVLITADYVPLEGSNGLNFTECNAVAKYFDCTDLYQMDGGGSVTALARQDDGTFKITNYPKDSGNPDYPRENLSYLFFVKRDPGVVQNQELSTHYSITLDKQEISGSAKIENIKVTLNDKEYEFGTNTQLTIDGLTQNTQYKVKLTYDLIENNKTTPDYVYINVITKEYVFPDEVIKVAEVTDTTIKFVKTSNDYATNISNIIIKVGNKTYNMGNQTEYICTELYKDVDYVVNCTYDIFDPASQVTFSGQTEEFNVHTKAFKDPTIEKFIEKRKGTSSLAFEYEFFDEDDVVEKAYVSVNGEVAKEVILENGSVTITGLDFDENEYVVKLVLEYISEDGETIKVESESFEYKHEQQVHEHKFVDGICECGEKDPNYEPPHEHKFVDGTCECGEKDPNYEPPHEHKFIDGICECGEKDPSYVAPSDEKKKCGKKSSELLIAALSLTAVIGIFFRKKH